MPTAWTNKDKQRVQRALSKISNKHGGWAALARSLGLKSRAVPQNWHARGRVPVTHVTAVIALAGETIKKLRPGDLSPDARHLES